jgi:hypothetical protein
MPTTAKDTSEAISISGVMVPDTKLAREATELVRDTEPSLLFNPNGQTIRTIAREAGQCTKIALSRRMERCNQRLTETHVFKHYTLRNRSLSGA